MLPKDSVCSKLLEKSKKIKKNKNTMKKLFLNAKINIYLPIARADFGSWKTQVLVLCRRDKEGSGVKIWLQLIN